MPPELIIGRAGEISDVRGRLEHGMSTMLAGERRIGKTTVCGAVCEQLRGAGALVIEVDVPERPDSRALLQLMIDACNRVSLADAGRRLLRTAQPLVEQLLAEHGVPLDLSALVLLRDLVDLYAGQRGPVVLVDGSNERALEGMFGEPVGFGKLVGRIGLSPSMPPDIWREPLSDRFARAGLRLPDDTREAILAWSEGRPYETMAAARYTALSARRLGRRTADDFDLELGLEQAKKHLEDDGAY